MTIFFVDWDGHVILAVSHHKMARQNHQSSIWKNLRNFYSPCTLAFGGWRLSCFLQVSIDTGQNEPKMSGN